MKLIFLDIDGVLNNHNFDEVIGSWRLEPNNIAVLNQILDAVPESQIILISAWRYMILNGAMTLKGFEYMLRVAGVRCKDRLLAHTASDAEVKGRAEQVRSSLNMLKGMFDGYVILEDQALFKDDQMLMEHQIMPFSNAGLEIYHADLAIETLNKEL